MGAERLGVGSGTMLCAIAERRHGARPIGERKHDRGPRAVVDPAGHALALAERQRAAGG
jgi:hypothetical protein